MNKKQQDCKIRLKKELKNLCRDRLLDLCNHVGVAEDEADILIDRFCLNKTLTYIEHKYNLTASTASEVINRNLDKILDYLCLDANLRDKIHNN